MSRLVEDYLIELFNEKNVSEANREKLWNHYYEKLSGGIDKVFTPAILEDSSELANSLKFSIAEFSAFKETAFRKDLEDLMTKEGKFVPWSEFKKEAMQVSGDYNTRWLETEYHQTVANAQSAAKWEDYKRNADMYPNLRYCTIGDDRVRPEHEVMDGIIKPLNDPFWDHWLPPNDWGCRCYVEQTDDEPTGTVPGGEQLKIEFENNPGESGKIFGDNSYKERITVSEGNEAVKNAGKWFHKINTGNEKRSRDYSSDKRRKQYLEALKPLLKKNMIRFVGNNESIKITHKTNGLKHIVDDVLFNTTGLTKKDLPKLHDYLKAAEFVKSQPLVKERKDNIRKFYYFKDKEKNIFYNVAETANKTKSGKVKIDRFLYAVTNEILKK